jgi:transcriptional regulator with GAF, ATPase, and Fis domain
MRERTITYTGSDNVPAGQGEPRPGLVVIFVGGARAPLGHVIDKHGARQHVIGRGDGADLILADPSVSRAHFVATAAEGGLSIRDLGSHNGTLVNGAPLRSAATTAPFGSILRLGKALLLVERDVTAFDGAIDARYPSLIGGPSLSAVRAKLDAAKDAAFPVLIEGETGAGKEVVARALHEASGRKGDLVEVNCAALPTELVESELFGHSKGSFSGSDRARLGLFRSAHQGTLLLDEIGELPPSMQAKLLRALETGEVRPVGEDRAIAVDVRVIAATNRDLGAMARDNAFRLDLFHRVAALRIALPPLRSRREDIPRLAEHFHPNLPIGASAMESLLLHDWPGNARELRNVLRAAEASALASMRDAIGPDDVKSALGPRPESMDDPERKRILDALAAANGNVTHAAQSLSVARSGLYEAIRRFKIDPTVYRK